MTNSGPTNYRHNLEVEEIGGRGEGINRVNYGGMHPEFIEMQMSRKQTETGEQVAV